MTFCVILFYNMYVLLRMSVLVVAIIIIIIVIIIIKEFLKFSCGTDIIGIKRSCMKKLTAYLN